MNKYEYGDFIFLSEDERRKAKIKKNIKYFLIGVAGALSVPLFILWFGCGIIAFS